MEELLALLLKIALYKLKIIKFILNLEKKAYLIERYFAQDNKIYMEDALKKYKSSKITFKPIYGAPTSSFINFSGVIGFNKDNQINGFKFQIQYMKFRMPLGKEKNYQCN